MKSRIILFIVLSLIILACDKEEEPESGIKKGTGTLWRSGGLYYCAEQIRMDNGDTLIVINREELYRFQSGDRVRITYIENGQNETGCTIGKDCEIIEIVTID